MPRACRILATQRCHCKPGRCIGARYYRPTVSRPRPPVHHVRSLVLAPLCTFACASGAYAAGADTYAIDPVHTRVMVAIDHAGFSDAIGTVSGSNGVLVFDRHDWRSARLDVRVPVARLNFGDAKWDAAVLAANLLDGARYPEARFVSTTAQPVAASVQPPTPLSEGSSRATVCGQLTLRGVSRPLCLEVTLNALKRHPMPPFRRTAGFSATATVRRSDYGIDAWPRLIGDNVELRIEAEAVRSPASEPVDVFPQTPAPTPPPEPSTPPAGSTTRSPAVIIEAAPTPPALPATALPEPPADPAP